MAYIQDFWVSSKTDGSTYHPLCQTAGHFYSSGLWYKVHKEDYWDNEKNEKRFSFASVWFSFDQGVFLLFNSPLKR